MGVIERDPHTGHGTTGHEWNGIKELNTAVPWLIWAFLIATVIFSVVWWILMPAWPLGDTYTKGLLGADVRQNVATDLKLAEEKRSIWASRIEKEELSAIMSDSELMQDIRETGHALFGDNCAACHGARAEGGPGYPKLTDPAWLWGQTPDAIFETIRAGVNSGHPDSRFSQMPAWGRDQMLDRKAIIDVSAFVKSLSDANTGGNGSPEQLAAGQKIFDDNCASCHGSDARGAHQTGAPDLTDNAWLYGGDAASIYESIYNGRQGHMPAWESRLTNADRKILMIYLLDLGQNSP